MIRDPHVCVCTRARVRERACTVVPASLQLKRLQWTQARETVAPQKQQRLLFSFNRGFLGLIGTPQKTSHFFFHKSCFVGARIPPATAAAAAAAIAGSESQLALMTLLHSQINLKSIQLWETLSRWVKLKRHDRIFMSHPGIWTRAVRYSKKDIQ